MFRSLIFALFAAWPACWAWNAWAAPPRLGYWPAFAMLAVLGMMVRFVTGGREPAEPEQSETAKT